MRKCPWNRINLYCGERLRTTTNRYLGRYYNGTVRDLNIAIQSFPASLVANALQFSPEPFFELDDPAARAAPEISFAGGKA
jgi:hypothetical protein